MLDQLDDALNVGEQVDDLIAQKGHRLSTASARRQSGWSVQIVV